jgi:RNA polymerase sigma-70 factor (ECF subfamily)
MTRHLAKHEPAARAAPQASDPDIMARLARADLGALGELYDRHRDAVRRFIRRATSDAEDVDDLVHATFLAAARSAGRYDGRPSCLPWLIGIAVLHIRRRRKALGRFLAVLASFGSARAASVDPRPTMQARSDVERALAGLSESKRIALLMAEVLGMSCAEIAATLHVPIGTVWTRLHAARREMRAALLEGDS